MAGVRGYSLTSMMVNQLILNDNFTGGSLHASIKRVNEAISQRWRFHDTSYGLFTMNVTNERDNYVPMSVKSGMQFDLRETLEGPTLASSATTSGTGYAPSTVDLFLGVPAAREIFKITILYRSHPTETDVVLRGPVEQYNEPFNFPVLTSHQLSLFMVAPYVGAQWQGHDSYGTSGARGFTYVSGSGFPAPVPTDALGATAGTNVNERYTADFDPSAVE